MSDEVRLVIDASVAIKWVVEEDGTDAALELLERHPLSAPDLLIAECANILWKKVRRGELETDEAMLAADLLQRVDVEILPTRALMAPALAMAIEVDHAAYDCVYLALAQQRGWLFASADARLRRKLANSAKAPYSAMILSLKEAAGLTELPRRST